MIACCTLVYCSTCYGFRMGTNLASLIAKGSKQYVPEERLLNPRFMPLGGRKSAIADLQELRWQNVNNLLSRYSQPRELKRSVH